MQKEHALEKSESIMHQMASWKQYLRRFSHKEEEDHDKDFCLSWKIYLRILKNLKRRLVIKEDCILWDWLNESRNISLTKGLMCQGKRYCLQRELTAEFYKKDLGLMRYLGLDVW